jgi:hypothetical protein
VGITWEVIERLTNVNHWWNIIVNSPREEMQKVLDVFTDYCKQWKLYVNIGRSDHWPDVAIQRWPIVMLLIGATLARRSVYNHMPTQSHHYPTSAQRQSKLFTTMCQPNPTKTKTKHNKTQ